MPVGVEQWRAAVGAMANSAAGKPPSPIGLRWKRWLKASDPVVYKGCIVLLVVLAQLAWSGLDRCRGEVEEEGSVCVGQETRTGKAQVPAVSRMSNAVLGTTFVVLSFLAQLLILLCGDMLPYHTHDECRWFNPVRGVLMILLPPLIYAKLAMKQFWEHFQYKVSTAAKAVLLCLRGRIALRVVVMIVFVTQLLLMMAGDVERNPGPGVAFTSSNILRAVEKVERLLGSGELGVYLSVPISKRDEIQRLSSSVPQKRKLLIQYWMEHNPRASWRGLIVALDGMKEKQVADKIRHLAEPVTDPTLTCNNLLQALASVHDWFSLGHGLYVSIGIGLGVPLSVCDEIRFSADYQTEEEKKKAMLLYYLHTVPQPSWQTVAGALYGMEEVTALEAVKVFLKHTPEPSLTPHNLSTVLHSMEDEQWDVFGDYANIPSSELSKIQSQYDSERERKQAVSHSLISDHPAPSWDLVAYTLYRMRSDDSHRALEHLQQLFPTGRHRSKQIYEKEMLLGFIELGIDKVVMFGIAGSGKTCSLAALLGLDPPDLRCSTPLMQRPIEVVVIHVDDQLHWQKKTPEQIRETVAEIIRSRMSVHQTEAKSSASPDTPGQQPPHTTDSQTPSLTGRMKSVVSEAARKQSVTSSEEKSVERVQSEAEGRLESLLQSSEVEEEFVSLINSSPPSSEPILRQKWTYVIDSGGQPQFHEVMPVFLNGASDFVFVFKVHESLDKRPMIAYFDDSGKLVCEPHPSFQTNKEILKQCTRTMRSFTAKNKDVPPPRMLFLATHRDMVVEESLPGVLDSLHKKLREILLPHFQEQIVFCDENMEDFIFTINAKKPEPKDMECAEAVRRCLSGKKEGSKTVKVPLRWYALHQKLEEIVEGLGKTVLTREQCRRGAESLGIDDESCEEALNFFNGLNILFYFPAILPDLVFLEPQVVLDKVTELVEASYRMSQGKKGQQPKPKQGDWLKFRDYGQVTEKFLSEFATHYEPPIFTTKELIQLFRGLLVFAELSEGVWFMPCLLKLVPSVDVEQYRVSQLGALALHFPDSGPLMGMFCCTVAYLLSPNNPHPCPWKVVQEKTGTPKCLKRNVIKFRVSDFPGAVSLIDHFTHFEIHVLTQPKKAAQLWRLAHDAVFAGLKKAGQTLGYTNNCPQSALVCPAHPATPHPATVDDEGAWMCSEETEEFGNVVKTSIPWLSDCKPLSTTPCVSVQSSPSSIEPHPPTLPDTKPTLLQLTLLTTSSGHSLEIIKNIAAKWKTVGIHLNFDPTGHTVDLIEERHPQRPEACCTDMMKEWLRGRGRQPANWATLVAVLRNAGFSELAGQVEQLVPTLTEGGRGGDRIELTSPSSLTEHQSHSPSQGGRGEGGGGRVVGRGRGRGTEGVERQPGQVWGQSTGRGRGRGRIVE